MLSIVLSCRKVEECMKKIINICNKLNYSGLNLDGDIISQLLERRGYRVYFNGHPYNIAGLPTIKKVYPKMFKYGLIFLSYLGVRRVSLNLHLECIYEKDIPLACKNIMIPNLEWLNDESFDLFSKMSLFICKTKSAKVYFNGLGLPAVYTSFTSVSPNDSSYKQTPLSFVHIAGTSTEKGTVPLVKTWAKHSEWPTLTVLSRSVEHLKEFEVANIKLIDGYVPRKKLRRIQNESEIHLCLSEAEGFGHYICEALGCGAIVVSVDGWPMNELVQPERGILIKSRHTEKMSKATRFFFDTADLEKNIVELLTMKEDEMNKIKCNARSWFEENELFFEENFASAIEHCIRS